MLTDAHCHPSDLLRYAPLLEDERRSLGVAIVASCWTREQFDFCEGLKLGRKQEAGIPWEAVRAPDAGGHLSSSEQMSRERPAPVSCPVCPPVVQCFAVHPQLLAVNVTAVDASLGALHALSAENRLDAIGETGFDLFDERFRAAEKVQDGLFAEHLEIAIAKGLPMVLHVRRAMHKVFALSQRLKKVPAVIFHSYPGTAREGGDLLKRGVNAYFSFGTTLLLNHKIARQACAGLPLERLLTETDAPYQPLRGIGYSAWRDLPAILGGMLALRGEGLPAQELERIICGNFFTAYMPAST